MVHAGDSGRDDRLWHYMAMEVNGMDKILYDAGYGNLAPAEFVALLKKAGVTVVLDIRRKGCKSWNGRYTQGKSMNQLMGDNSFAYNPWPGLGNQYDRLSGYTGWLADNKRAKSLLYMLGDIIGRHEDVCVCRSGSEGKPFEADGTTPRCHRVYVAEALLAELGEGWTIKHLQKGE